MIAKVRKMWIIDFLDKSLFHEVRLLLGLEEHPDAVARPMDLIAQRPDLGERLLPPGTRVVDVYDEMDQALLILGQPGSGKTTLLLELCRDLLDRAEQNAAHPIPVVFPLSTWGESRRPLAEWLAEELNLRYDVPRRLAQEWVNADQVLSLLDRLDEVKAKHRAACVEAINAYRQEHGLLPLVVSSRKTDYEALESPLRLHGAIVVQQLTAQQVESYLSEIGPAGEAVRRANCEDPMLREMLDTLLMLNLVAMGYAGQPDSQPPLRGNLNERREHLLGVYADQMFRRRGVDQCYPQQQTIHWLTWLASQMVLHSQTVFYIERLRPDWLPEENRSAFGLVYSLVVGLVVGLVYGLGAWLVFGPVFGPVVGSVAGLVWGLASGLGCGLVMRPSKEILCAEIVNWSRPKVSKRALVGGLVGGLFLGLVAGLGFGPVYGLVVGLVAGLVDSLVVWLEEGLSVGEIETRNFPNQGIHRSIWNALVCGPVVGLVVGVVVGLGFGPVVGVVGGPVVGLGCGLVIGLVYG
jgi:hypothetical protein